MGRPVLWGLAAAGEDGVRRVLELLVTELCQDARQCGVADLADLGPGLLRRSDRPAPPDSEGVRGR